MFEADSDLPFRDHDLSHAHTNFWWIELGGEQDTIRDTQAICDELLKVAFGVWDHIKNRGDHGAANWTLDWVGFLPGKRESRRYVGDYILTQKDVRAGGRFADIVAYGGWSMDDHHPAGIRHPGRPTIFHPAPSPFGIPYRCLYSRNVANLFCAGRNISATHAAMSATRVMATCALLGQAVGTAAAIAAARSLDPRDVYEQCMGDLQQALMDDDCWLPGRRRTCSPLAAKAALCASTGDPTPLLNGMDRPEADNDNAWTGRPGDWIEFRFPGPERIRGVRLVFDSDLNRAEPTMPCSYPLKPRRFPLPASLVKSFRIEAESGSGQWRTLHSCAENRQRLVRVPLDTQTRAVRCAFDATWGAPDVRVFATEIV